MSNYRKHAMLGALAADALAMPVHWYYDTEALDRDYPQLDSYQAPRNPHPDSILWRSKYTPRNQEADILHDQAKFWGERGIHYHQRMSAGDNTLNFLLGAQLFRLLVDGAKYDPIEWLECYVECMRTPGWHRDTYVEEYHRAFFDNRARGRALDKCGIEDIHIGGLTHVPFMLAGLESFVNQTVEEKVALVQSHLALTHRGRAISDAGKIFVELIEALSDGAPLRDAIEEHASSLVSSGQLDTWTRFEDRVVVGRHLTTACYLPESFIAALYLAWKYHKAFEAGIVANARCGGDNAHRGVVVGALLGTYNGVPKKWRSGLRAIDRFELDSCKS